MHLDTTTTTTTSITAAATTPTPVIPGINTFDASHAFRMFNIAHQ